MAAELVAVGLRPVLLPCVRIQVGSDADLARARAAAEEADLLVLTSSRALDVLWPATEVPSTPIATLSTVAAATAQERGGRVTYTGTGIPAEFIDFLVRRAAGKRVAYPHCEDADPRVVLALADVASDLVAVSVYGWVPVPPPPDPVEAVAFETPLAVEGWAQARDFEGLLVAAIGPGTAAALRRHARAPDVFTRRPSFGLLAETLAGALLSVR